MKFVTSISNALVKLFADSDDPMYSTYNAIAQQGIMPISDDRLGLTGSYNPATEALVAGSATNWYLASGGSKSIRVAYRRGTNRSPQLRSFTMSEGRWGVGWDINFDIGAAFMDYRGWHKSTGAG